MKIFFFSKRMKIVLGILLLVLFLGGFFLQHAPRLQMVNAPLFSYTIVVDAGHGKPDGGAVSQDGVEEEALNLSIALILREKLEMLGYDVVMTRETHENIADENQKNTIREIKKSDLENRVKIANQSHADFMISIHMNQFSQSSYWGWQTFYSKESKEGRMIAQFVQEGISHAIQRKNSRTILPIDNIKIVNQTTLPVIIVECGFLSNEEDLRLLQTKEYQEKIAEGIVNRD